MEEALNAARGEALNAASREGNVDALYHLIQQAPDFLSNPLHEAARAGQTEFAIELLTLMPSFAKELNPQGLSPLHLAVMSEADELTEERARKNKTAMALIKLDAELVRVKGGARMTPLHHAVIEDNVELLAEFLCACPKSINDLTNKDQSAVHIAVQERMSDALKVLLGWLSRRNKEGVLRFKDSDGNTALHIAVETEQFEVVEKLISKVNRNTLNSKGLTPWDIAVQKRNENIKKFLKNRGGRSAKDLPEKERLHEFLKSKQGPFEKPIGYLIYVDKEMSLEMRNIILVVAVLIITATFQGALQPPGGFWQGNGETSRKVSTFNRPGNSNSNKFYLYHSRKQHNMTGVVGKVIMSPGNFGDFMGGNTVAFVFATAVIFWALPARPYIYCLHISLLFLTYAYLTAVDIISDQNVLTTSLIIVTWLFICGVLALRFYMHIAKSIFNDAWWLPKLYVLATNTFYQIPTNPVAIRLNRFANRLMMHHKVSRLETEEID
ncbi:ankyrin repeat-containing protein BDA1-like [Coffea eugenioides]|uniref:Ankyrin repeat-containing protein BDA1-like n=1 Tax=Coffea arabica TaxID=13443 RepID=A0ABM4VBM1_COFAR|nr:ankyrin repeat-containing protein BDA1-like [Coffea eugenioides]